MRVEVAVPGLLSDCIGSRRRLHIEADTISGALTSLFHEHPRLRVHVYDERGHTRRHVLIYYNDTNTAWLETLDVPLREGDRITILQAVSGG